MLITEQLQLKQTLFKGHDPFSYRRRKTRVVMVGHVGVGGLNPLRVQSMTTTSTMDTQATVDQIKRLADVGCEIARVTAPTIKEAYNLEKIKSQLIQAGLQIPLVADIHFRPDAALAAADFVEKVRINPGNFSDSKIFRTREYSDEQYQSELKRIEEIFTPLVLKLKKGGRSLRIGTNHGSLSDRIMNRFGDTPLGMVESALEFVRICEKNDFYNIILSMKASNPKVMIAAYRLLSQRMALEGMDYPFHLGVTEAGDGEDGRIKSAVGIGSLLEDGIGDTIRVSLTEDPEKEIPVAMELARRFSPQRMPWPHSQNGIKENEQINYVGDFFNFSKRKTADILSGPIQLGGNAPIRLISRIKLQADSVSRVMELLERRLKSDTPPEILEIPYDGWNFPIIFEDFRNRLKNETGRLALWLSFEGGQLPPVIDYSSDGIIYDLPGEIIPEELNLLVRACQKNKIPLILRSSLNKVILDHLRWFRHQNVFLGVGVAAEGGSNFVHNVRKLVARLKEQDLSLPILFFDHHNHPGLAAASAWGSLICDGIGDAIRVSFDEPRESHFDFGYQLFQATGDRFTKTEFVSCPSCGRTLFDLQSTTERIKAQTGHLKGVKIAIMGCIVNGPGEMADAHFGYVGGGPGKINLYVGKTCVQKSIPADIADQKLVELIKAHGKWVDPS